MADAPKIDRWLPDVDLVHGTNYVVPPTRRPAVVTVYDCWFLAHPDQAAPAVRRAASLLRRAVQRGAHVHTSSAATADQVREHLGSDRVSVVHLGPPAAPAAAAAAPPGIALGQQFILSIGTLERRKGLPSLVRAFGEIASDRSDLRLVLAGVDGDDGDAVARAVDAIAPEARPRVVRTGAVSPGEKAWLLRNAALLAYPSLDEGFGFPVLEAQAASLPVVATAVGSLREIGGDGVAFVDGHDHTDLATQLVHVLDNGMTRLGLIEAGHRNVQRFSWSRTADELVTLYTRVVDEATTT